MYFNTNDAHAIIQRYFNNLYAINNKIGNTPLIIQSLRREVVIAWQCVGHAHTSAIAT